MSSKTVEGTVFEHGRPQSLFVLRKYTENLFFVSMVIYESTKIMILSRISSLLGG